MNTTGLKLALFNAADFVKKSRFPSLGLAYIASYLKKYSDIKDIHILEDNVAVKLKRLKPDIVGIYSVTQTFKEACFIAGLIKREYKDMPLIIGGYHITALPHTLPKSFDIAVLGEGEETMRELMETISRYGIESDKLSAVRGIAFHDGEKVIITPKREFIVELDYIPFPARELLINTAFSSMITSRGCPHKCIFCSSVKFWGKPRFNSSGYVVSEIEGLISKYRVVHISIWDDLFIADHARFAAIVELINKNKINKKISFGCALRSDLVNPETCALLYKMNVKRVSIGFESGSQRILDMLKCNSVTVEQHIEAVKLCKSYGFFVTGTFMIGNIEENEDDLNKTLELINNLRLNGGGNISLASPLPGTALWNYAKKRNLVNDEMDFSRIGLMATDFTKPQDFRGILLTDKIPKEIFFRIAQNLQKESNRYYLRGLLHRTNLSLRNFRFILARPKEVLAILSFLIKSLLRKASIMDRYVFYYKKL